MHYITKRDDKPVCMHDAYANTAKLPDTNSIVVSLLDDKAGEGIRLILSKDELVSLANGLIKTILKLDHPDEPTPESPTQH